MSATEFNKVPNIALDTCTIISLANYKSRKPAKIAELKQKGILNDIKILLEQIESKQILPIITPTVEQELLVNNDKYTYDINKFMNHFQIYHFYNDETSKGFSQQAEKLANIYSNPIEAKTYQEILSNRQMLAKAYKKGSKEYKAELNRFIAPTIFYKDQNPDKTYTIKKDAIIMAEATLLGLPLVTLNTLDFIVDGRQEALSIINRKLGKGASLPLSPRDWNYYYNNQTIKPITSEEYQQNLKKTTPMQQNKKIEKPTNVERTL